MANNHIKINVGTIEHMIHETTLKKLYLIYSDHCYKMSIIPEDRFEEEKWLKHFQEIETNQYPTYKLFEVFKVVVFLFIIVFSLTVSAFLSEIYPISNFTGLLKGSFITVPIGVMLGYNYAKLIIVLSAILKQKNP